VRTEGYYERALKLARAYGGKVMILPKVPVRGMEDFSLLYTPGVAEVSKRIEQEPEESFELTNRWNTVAVVSDGSRVLGLGRLRPEAALPVLEGKAILFKYLGAVDAVPLAIAAEGAEAIVDVIRSLEPALGGVNLEDIESPKCFYVLEELRRVLSIPVWHDDQLGTAGVVLAALYGALDLTGLSLEECRIALVGAGAANIATARLLELAGAKLSNLILVDSKGILHPEREDMDGLMLRNKWKYELAIRTNGERRRGGIREALKGAHVLIAASRPGPGVISRSWLQEMARPSIVFALANPVPEIEPTEALSAGASVVATGRSDYPNQVNNSLLFPSVFRGALDVRAKAITEEIVIAASKEIYSYTKETGLRRDRIVPSMVEWEVYPRVAAAVGAHASELGLARRPMGRQELLDSARRQIARVRTMMDALAASNLLEA
jgi:malate dehydrogenase (oxaloacetate-decarboxylating)